MRSLSGSTQNVIDENTIADHTFSLGFSGFTPAVFVARTSLACPELSSVGPCARVMRENRGASVSVCLFRHLLNFKHRRPGRIRSILSSRALPIDFFNFAVAVARREQVAKRTFISLSGRRAPREKRPRAEEARQIAVEEGNYQWLPIFWMIQKMPSHSRYCFVAMLAFSICNSTCIKYFDIF